MIKCFWEKIVEQFKRQEINSQLINRLNSNLDNLKNEKIKKNFKKISKSKIDILETPDEHREKFLTALDHTEESLVILSNWNSSYVMNDEFESSLRSCLAKGVNVHVGYILSESNNPKQEPEIDKIAKEKIKSLQEWCYQELGQGCRLHEIDDTKPTAILIVDDKYIINGESKQKDISWVIYDKSFVTAERNAIIGTLDSPIELTRRGLLRRFMPGDLNE